MEHEEFVTTTFEGKIGYIDTIVRDFADCLDHWHIINGPKTEALAERARLWLYAGNPVLYVKDGETELLSADMLTEDEAECYVFDEKKRELRVRLDKLPSRHYGDMAKKGGLPESASYDMKSEKIDDALNVYAGYCGASRQAIKMLDHANVFTALERRDSTRDLWRKLAEDALVAQNQWNNVLDIAEWKVIDQSVNTWELTESEKEQLTNPILAIGGWADYAIEGDFQCDFTSAGWHEGRLVGIVNEAKSKYPYTGRATEFINAIEESFLNNPIHYV